MIKVIAAPAYLAARFRDLRPHERVEARTLRPDGRPGPRLWDADPARLARRALALKDNLNVYYGMNPRRDGGGKKADVTSIGTLYADVDNKHFADGRAGAVAALAAFPLPPTWIIDSGGGLQPSWQLFAALPLTGPDDPLVARVEGLQSRLYTRLGHLDSVQDLSRILRLPATLNHKYDPARPVRIVHHDPDAAYTLADFEVLLPAPVEAPRPRPTIPHGATGGHGLPSLAEVRKLLTFIPPRGDYKADWLTVLAAVHSIYPGPEGEAICEEWSAGTPGEVARKFKSFGRYRGQRGPVGVGTLFHLAKLGGWRPTPETRFRLRAKEVGYGRV